MAKRQDSGSGSAPENERPTSRDEDTFPEQTEPIGRRDEDDIEEIEEIDIEEFDEDEGDEGNY